MKIVLIIPSLDAGGAERMLSELANYWSAQGHQVSIVHMKPDGYVSFYPLHASISMVPMSSGRLAHPDSQIGKSLIYLKAIFHVRKKIKKIQPDIVISFLKTTNMVTLLATHGLSIPIIISERSDPTNDRNSIIFDWIRQRLYTRARQIVMQTESAAAFFKPIFKDRIRILPNWVRCPQTIKSSAELQQPVQNIISVGRLISSKGFEDLIQSFNQLASDCPDIQLTIYGEGPQRSAIETLIRSLGLQNRVYLPGTIQNVAKVLTQSDLFVFSSQHEGFPNVLCEALSVGLPVIASDCSGNVDVVTDRMNGRLFPVGNVDRCAQLIKELIEDVDQRIFLSQNALKICDTLSPDRIFAQWDQMIEEAVQSYIPV